MAGNEVAKSDRVERAERAPESVLGQWFWITTTSWKDEKERWLGCIIHEGSNYVLLRGVQWRRGSCP